MARNRASAKKAGASFERLIADHLAGQLDSRIDRKVRTGAKDTGDIAGVYDAHGNAITVECKNVTTQALPQWTREAEQESVNAGTLTGVVIAKRHGNGKPGEQWVHMTVDDLVRLLRGRA